MPVVEWDKEDEGRMAEVQDGSVLVSLGSCISFSRISYRLCFTYLLSPDQNGNNGLYP